MGSGRSLALCVCASIAACATPAEPPRADLPTVSGGSPARAASPAPARTEVARADRPLTEDVSPRRDLALPHGWASASTAAFDAALDRWNPLGSPGRLTDADLDELRGALEGPSPAALRAVLLLVASAAPEATAVLRERLERRIRTAEGGLPAVDLAAAIGLGRAGPQGGALADTLADLAQGRRPHPVLSVRVECAISAFALGRADLAKFLAAVLLDGTTESSAQPPAARGAASIEEMAYAQWRASAALSRHARIENPYRPEASAVDRARAAAEIARAIQGLSNEASPP